MSTTILEPRSSAPSRPADASASESHTLTSSALFRDWLIGLGENTICGQRGSAIGCPLARYLDGLNGVEWADYALWTHKAAVRPFSYEVGLECDVLPPWARRFVHALDLRYSMVPVAPDVTSAAALALLDKVDEKVDEKGG